MMSSIFWTIVMLVCCMGMFALARPQKRIQVSRNGKGVTSDDVITTTSTPSVLEVFFNDLVKLQSGMQRNHGHHHAQIAHGTNMAAQTPEDSDDSHGDLLSTILHNVRIGHVTNDDVINWLAEIKADVANGIITAGKMNSFLSALPNMALRNSLKDECCVFG